MVFWYKWNQLGSTYKLDETSWPSKQNAHGEGVVNGIVVSFTVPEKRVDGNDSYGSSLSSLKSLYILSYKI